MEGSPQPPAQQGRGLRFWVFAIVAAYAALFVLLNSQEVKIKFVFATTTAPLVFALLLALVLGILIGFLGSRFRSGRKSEP